MYLCLYSFLMRLHILQRLQALLGVILQMVQGIFPLKVLMTST